MTERIPGREWQEETNSSAEAVVVGRELLWFGLLCDFAEVTQREKVIPRQREQPGQRPGRGTELFSSNKGPNPNNLQLATELQRILGSEWRIARTWS